MRFNLMRGVAMDFLEGFLLGPIWSDTEYETRRHTGFYWLIGWLAFAGYIVLLLEPSVAAGWIGLPRYVPIVYFVLLTLASPFACRYYYRLNPILKVLILLIQISKLAAALLALYQFVLPKYTLEPDTLPQTILEYVNQTIAKATDSLESLGHGVGMLAGIITGGMLVVLTFVGILLFATLVPAIYLAVLKLLQRGIDLLTNRFLLHNLDN